MCLQVPRVRKSLNSGDVFILDLGRMIYQWNGSGSNKDERMKVSNLVAVFRIKAQFPHIGLAQVIHVHSKVRNSQDGQKSVY